jgi:hypothetical protein
VQDVLYAEKKLTGHHVQIGPVEVVEREYGGQLVLAQYFIQDDVVLPLQEIEHLRSDDLVFYVLVVKPVPEVFVPASSVYVPKILLAIIEYVGHSLQVLQRFGGEVVPGF